LLDAERWETLTGKTLRLEMDFAGDKILMAGHIVKDKWIPVGSIGNQKGGEG